jgi:hypothetical protein
MKQNLNTNKVFINRSKTLFTILIILFILLIIIILNNCFDIIPTMSAEELEFVHIRAEDLKHIRQIFLAENYKGYVFKYLCQSVDIIPPRLNANISLIIPNPVNIPFTNFGLFKMKQDILLSDYSVRFINYSGIEETKLITRV